MLSCVLPKPGQSFAAAAAFVSVAALAFDVPPADLSAHDGGTCNHDGCGNRCQRPAD